MITALMLLGGIDFAPALTGPYLKTDLGIAVAQPLTVHGSDNDWGTKCDLIINPHGLETAGECGAAPPRTSWTNELGGGSGITAGFTAGYDGGDSVSKTSISSGSLHTTVERTPPSSTR